jgi:hypothetical protein
VSVAAPRRTTMLRFATPMPMPRASNAMESLDTVRCTPNVASRSLLYRRTVSECARTVPWSVSIVTATAARR